MRQQLLCSVAAVAIMTAMSGPVAAADVPLKARPAPAPLVYAPSWSGLYIGGHLGAGWGTFAWENYQSTGGTFAHSPATMGSASMDGFLGGAQIGFNWQSGKWVFGVEGTWSWTNIEGQFVNDGPISQGPQRFPKGTASTHLDWIATLVGRVGVTVDRALIYAGGGGAWTKEKDNLFAGSFATNASGSAEYWDGSKTRSGFTFLTGVEYAIDPNWSAKIQYNYYDFGTKTVSLAGGSPGINPGFPGFDIDTTLRIHSITAGVNYRFNWGKAPVGGIAALAADAGVYKAPIAASLPIWSGLYIGGHLGAGWGTFAWENYQSTGGTFAHSPATMGSASMDGFLGGAQIGFNWQSGKWVFGVEGTWSWTNIEGQFVNDGPISQGPQRFPKGTASTHLDWIATLVGRVGVTVDRALIYAGGGGAWTKEKDNLFAGSFATNASGSAEYWDGSKTRSGFTFLTGVEYAIDPNWSAKVQYNYYDFGTKTVSLAGGSPGINPGFPGFDIDTTLRIHSITAGVNYRFNWGKAPVGGIAALAADASVYKAPIAASLPIWSGLYVGGHLGAGWGTFVWENYQSTGGTFAHSPSTMGNASMAGFLGGAQIGFNWQTGKWVFGVEGTWSWTNIEGQFVNDGPISQGPQRFPKGTASTHLDWIATLVGRVGVTVDRALVYAGGGGAWAKEKDNLFAGSFATNASGSAEYWDGSQTRSGFTFLTGVEYAIDPNWSAKIQYNYYDFGTKTVSLAGGSPGINPGFPGFDVDAHLRIHAITAGVNYRFNWGKAPIVAKY